MPNIKNGHQNAIDRKIVPENFKSKRPGVWLMISYQVSSGTPGPVLHTVSLACSSPPGRLEVPWPLFRGIVRAALAFRLLSRPVRSFSGG